MCSAPLASKLKMLFQFMFPSTKEEKKKRLAAKLAEINKQKVWRIGARLRLSRVVV